MSPKKKIKPGFYQKDVPEEYVLKLFELIDKRLVEPNNVNRYNLLQLIREILGEQFDRDIDYRLDLKHILYPKIVWEIEQ